MTEHQIVTGDTLGVWFSDNLVGHLKRKSENIVDIAFSYSDEWLTHPGAFPISLTMPMSAREYGPETVYPWFMNLLPEGRALQIVGNVLKVAEIDVFAMIEEMGGDLPGALAIRRHADPVASYGHPPGVRRLTEAELADCIRLLPERPVLVGSEGVSMSMAGAQDKLPVIRMKGGQLALPLYGMPSTHILKPRNKKFRDSVPNEAYCMMLAKAVGLQVAPVSIGHAEDIDYLLVRRYDRVIDGGTIRRIHQEDLCQATGFPPYLKYEWNQEIQKHGPSLADCMGAIGRAPGGAMNRIRFFEAMLFNILTGNVDAHLKNYSLLIKSGGQIEFAPIYDVMNGDIYPGVTRNLAMKVADKQRGGHLHGRHWERFADENGLSPTHIKNRVAAISKSVLEKAPIVAEDMANTFGDAGVYQEIFKYVCDYCRRMLSNLKTTPDAEDTQTIAALPRLAPARPKKGKAADDLDVDAALKRINAAEEEAHKRRDEAKPEDDTPSSSRCPGEP